MSRRYLNILLTGAFLVLPITQAYAQENDAKAKTEAQATQEDPDGLTVNERAKKDALTEKVSGVLKQLDLNQIQHFTVIYANYMIVSMVKAVQNDVGVAVGGCGEKNKDMKGDMDERFNNWKATVSAPMAEAQANIDNMIVAQNYLPKAKFDDIFALVDETRKVNSSEFQKVPIDTPEACKYMLGKMDETEKNMVQLLQSTLVTYPDLLKKTQE